MGYYTVKHIARLTTFFLSSFPGDVSSVRALDQRNMLYSTGTVPKLHSGSGTCMMAPRQELGPRGELDPNKKIPMVYHTVTAGT
jgi:hypothetical protein